MAIINTNDLELLRNRGHKTSTYVSFNKPEEIWYGTVSVEPSRFDSTISFNAGSGTTSMIRPDMDVVIGTISINNPERDIVRLREFNSGDGGVTGTIKISANNWDFAIGDRISIKLNFRLNPRFPKIEGDALSAIFYKDVDVAYSNQHQNLAPVVIAGGNRALWLHDPIINPHLEESYAMSPSATLTSYSATPLYVSGTLPTVSINGSTGVGTITFNSTGQFWIEYEVIDSNATSQKSYRFYRIHDGDDMPMIDVGITSVTGDWGSGGYSATIQPYGTDTGLNDIPDQTQVIIWQDSIYGTTEKAITVLPDQSNVLISGYLRKETVTRDINTGTGNVSFQVNTIQEVMSNHFQFSMSIEARPVTPTKWYEFRNELTTLRGVHSFWKYQSTLLEVCDVIGLNNDTDMLRPYVELGSGNLFSMVDSLLKNTSIRYAVVCDHGGSIHCTPELQLLTDEERALLSEVIELEMDDSSTQETILRNTPNTTALFRTSGFYWDGTFKTDGCPTEATGNSCPNSTPFCSVSGEWPLDEGGNISNFDRQTLRSQTHANEIAGRKLAWTNNLYPEIRLTMHGNYFGIFDPAFPYFYTKLYQQVDTIREFTITDKKTFLRNVTTTIDPLKGTSQTNIVIEVEVEAIDGVFEECVSGFPNNSGETPSTGISGTNCGEPIYTAGDDGFERFYNCTTPVWDRPTDEIIYDMRVDPYYWSRPWRCGEGYIKRSEDWGTTWIDVTPINPPNDAGDIPAPTSADLIFEHMDVSYPNEGEYIFLANWDRMRTWIVHTTDNGVSWDWEAIGETAAGFVEQNTQFFDTVHPYVPYLHGMESIHEYCATWARYDNTTGDYTVYLADTAIHTISNLDSVVVSTGFADVLTTIHMSDLMLVSSYHTGGATGDLILKIIEVTPCTTITPTVHTLTIPSIDYQYVSISKLSNSRIMITTNKSTMTLFIYDVDLGSGFSYLTEQVVSGAGSHPSLFGSNRECAIALAPNIGVVRYDDTFSGGYWTKGISLFQLTGSTITFLTTHTLTSLPSVAMELQVPIRIDSEYYIDFYSEVVTNVMHAILIRNNAGVLEEHSHIVVDPLGLGGGKGQIASILHTINPPTRVLFAFLDDDASLNRGTMGVIDVDLSIQNITVSSDTFEIFMNAGSPALGIRPFDDTIMTISGVAPPISINATYFSWVTYGGSGSGGISILDSLEGLGIALSRNTASKTYLTLMDHTTNKIYDMVYDIPLVFNTNTVIKDGVTTSQLDARTYWAYPVTDWFDDDICYIHGRFSYPNTLNHSIKTIDGGTTWIDNGADVGNDHISSLFNYLDGTQQIVRSKVSGVSQLYLVNNGVLNFRSNIPFLQWVRPHAMSIGGGGSYFGSWTPQPYMITKTVYPLTLYRNYTFNHETGGRVMSVESPK